MSIIIQISYAYLSLHGKSKGSIAAFKIDAEDVMLLKTNKTLITYYGEGILKTHGVVALIVNYAEWRGYVTIGNKMYPIPVSSESEEDHKYSDFNPLSHFISSILELIPEPRKNNTEMYELHRRLTNISRRAASVSLGDSTTVASTTGVISATVKIITEEFQTLDFYKNVWTVSKNVTVSSSSNIYYLAESVEKYTEDWMHIRAAYSRTASRSILNAAVKTIQNRQNEYYNMAINAEKALIKGDDLLVVAVLSLDLFSSLWRIANHLIPDDPAVTAMRQFIIDNWSFEDEGLINYIEDDNLASYIEDRILDLDEELEVS